MKHSYGNILRHFGKKLLQSEPAYQTGPRAPSAYALSVISWNKAY